MKPSEYVAEVADDLKTNGWIQGNLHSAEGSCLLGAIVNVGLRHIVHANESGRMAQFYIGAKLRERTNSTISVWNDTPGRTLNEVLDLLHDCQVGLKEMGK